MMSLTSLRDRGYDADIMSAVAIMANAAMAKAEMLGLCPEISADEAHTVHALSERQVEILKWIAEGKSNPAIATITGLNDRAVRFHVSEILRKLGIASRSQAGAIYRAGIPAFHGRGQSCGRLAR